MSEETEVTFSVLRYCLHQSCKQMSELFFFFFCGFFQSQCNGVVEWLQCLCTNDVNIPVGGIVHTGMLNERGGYENDCLLVRERENW